MLLQKLLEDSFPALRNVAHAVFRLTVEFIVLALRAPFNEAVFRQVRIQNSLRLRHLGNVLLDGLFRGRITPPLGFASA